MKMEIQYGLEPPKRGKALIYFLTKLYYGTYRLEGNELELDGAISDMTEQGQREILEMHLFDEDTEYRKVHSQARRGYIEALINDRTTKSDLNIMENCFLLQEYLPEEKLGVVSYLQYDENDMLELINYRLCMAKGESKNE